MRLRGLMSLLPALVTGLAGAATVEQPRAFGHVLGDVLTQRVLLQHEGRGVAATAPPPPDRVGLWLERRAPRAETDAQGRGWLAIDYQVVNAPRSLSIATLPALSIAVDAGTPLSLPAWPVSIGPLTPPEAFGQGALQAMRPDRPVTPRSTAPIERQLHCSIAALAIVLLSWLAWWSTRQWRDARRLPYALAWRELRRLDPASPQAWLAMHRAIDAGAGRVVQSATLPRLFAESPQLQPLRQQLEEFYRRSDQRFYADARDTPPYPLRDLARALRDTEKRHR